MGRKAMAYAVHAARWNELDALIEAAYAEFGRIDILVNNAGGTVPTPNVEDVPALVAQIQGEHAIIVRMNLVPEGAAA